MTPGNGVCDKGVQSMKLSEMKIDTVRVEDLKPYAKNTRIHGKRNLEAIKKSLEAFGQTKPLVVRKATNEILCGNGTYEAAVALGWKEMQCHIIDIDEERAKALMIADNRTSDLSENDEKNLLDMLQEMDADMLDLTGYDNEELDKMLQFHEGSLFDDDKNEKKEKKPKEEKKDAPVSADDQISFILMGYPFVLADVDQIKEIKDLMDKFTTQNIEVRCETTFEMWNAIRDVLKNAVAQDEQPPADFEMETDRG